MVRYPVTLVPDDNGTLLVNFPDFPEAHTFGDDAADALARGVDALETVIDAYIRARRAIPRPSSTSGPDRTSVTLPARVAAKVQIYEAMQQQNVNKSVLAKRMRVHLPQVDRLLDVRHGSKIEQLEAAANALGGVLDVIFVADAGESTDALRMRVREATNDRRRHGHGLSSTGTRVPASKMGNKLTRSRSRSESLTRSKKR